MGWGFNEELESDSIRITRGEFAKTDSLADYDVVFVDPEEIEGLWTTHLAPQSDGKFMTNPEEDGGLARGLENLMEERREEAVQLIEKTGGAIFCKLRSPGRELTVVERDEQKEINRYSWLPKFENNLLRAGAIEARKGKRLSSRDISSPVAVLLGELQDRVSYEAVIKREAMNSDGSLEVFSETPTNDIASVGFPRGKGSFVFLPARLEFELPEERKLIEAARKVATRGAYHRPSWLNNYSLPTETDIKNEVKKINREVSRLEKQRREKEKELRDIDLIKGLLSSRTNHGLKSSLSRALEVAGFNARGGDSGIDLMVTDSDDVNFAITIGVNPEEPVGLGPYHRLVQGINELKIFENKDPQGIVVVNGYGAENPENRGKQWREELLEGCNLYGFTLVTSEEIFEKIQKIKEGEVGSRGGLIELFESG